jgi:hypothetical protein
MATTEVTTFSLRKHVLDEEIVFNPHFLVLRQKCAGQ